VALLVLAAALALFIKARIDPGADRGSLQYLWHSDEAGSSEWFSFEAPQVGKDEGALARLVQVELCVRSHFDEPVLLVQATGHTQGSAELFQASWVSDGVHRGQFDERRGTANITLLCKDCTLPGSVSRENGHHRLLFRDCSGGAGPAAPMKVYSAAFAVPAGTVNVSLSWRVEYTSFAESLRDFPVPNSSFVGVEAGALELQPAPDAPSATRGSIWTMWVRHTEQGLDWVVAGNTLFSLQVPSAPSCPDWRGEPSAARITLIGDSQPMYMCSDFRDLHSDTAIVCHQVKGVMLKRVDRLVSIFGLENDNIGPVFLSLIGLWEAAYGNLTTYQKNVNVVLRAALKSTFSKIFVLTTTAVHPYLYHGLARDKSKWAMTMTRVAALNDRVWAAVEDIGEFDRVRLVDLETLSLARDSDPRVAHDMRHFGPETNALLLQYALCIGELSGYGQF